ncbi:MAG: HDIG domain-containing protein [Desulfobacteraceae bacterium]|nr:MAG: HDIG domain-containing protein [Desulfobacteraceae bacterium]
MSGISDPGITRDDALKLLHAHLENEKLISHCAASEAIMRALADRFEESPDVWGMAGLLHDLDFQVTEEDPARHGLLAAEILREKGVHEEVINAIQKHNAEGLGLLRATRFEHALACAESITGLIVATALVYPDRKLSSVKVKSVSKRMKTAHFARAVSRERILECETIGIPIEDFIGICLEAMKGISDELGL